MSIWSRMWLRASQDSTLLPSHSVHTFIKCVYALSPVCFTVCLFISPDLDGYRASLTLHRLSPRAKGHFIRFSVLTIDEKSSFTNQSHNRNNHKTTTGFRANGRVIQKRGREMATVRGNNLFIWAPPGADGICLSIKLEAQTLTPQLGLWFLAADATRSWRHVLLLSIPPQVP